MSTIPLNGEPPLGYRIGESDRTIGDPATEPEGFYCLNQTTGNAFQVSGGVWVSATFPADLLDAWFATIPGVNPPGQGYRIGNSDRATGTSTATPENFIVVNTTNSKVFQVQGGVWTDVSGSFNPTTLTNLLAAWQAA